jgi:glycerophosphoryl diester phosphodiesterase
MGEGGITESRLLVIGHRGASAYAPENTLASFDMAQRDGADGIEFDVRLARDEVPVVFHDDSFERTVGIYGNVESHSSAVISQFYAGEWFNQRYPNRARASYASERVPTLAQVFERYGSLRRLYVEMKCEDVSRRPRLAQAVVRLVREYGLAERVVVKSFEHDSLGEVKRLAPEIRTAALFGRSWPNPFVPARKIIAGAEACGADEISLHRSLLRAATVREARRRGFEVLVWTVNSSVWLRRALALGLRAVFTDYPGWMRNHLFERLLPAGAERREN